MLNLFELSLRFNGFPIKEAKQLLGEIQAIPEADYKEYIFGRQKSILLFHLTENSFYKNFAPHANAENWAKVPIMTKSDLQKPLAERLSNGFSKKKVYVNKTSGSSGHPFIFAKDKFCHALTWAEILDRFGWYGIDFHSSYQARFYGIPLDTVGYRKERFKDWLGRRYRFPIFDLSEEKMRQFLEHFRRKKFDHINGYTSSIVLFAKYVQSQGLILKNICPTLKYCIVTSEMLYDSDKALMEEAFGVPVINEYGASELDLIAFTNMHDQFVLNSETLYVEVVDDKGMPVPNGEPGRIIITSLYNKAHPMIRYDIGDTGIIHPDSTAKKPILQKLIGRTNDLAKLPGGKTVPGLTFYYVTKSVIEDDGNVKEFIIEQTALDRFRIIYVSERELTQSEIEAIQKALYTYLENDLTLTFEREEALDRSRRGKLKQFTSLL
ncbi:phenylacetate--CoA ligase family protein [Aureitalea sp. L0-47]|uniref:phenylacetate--CoA ligase family protein n=1 Tax=Aureitalea sp. L0-47 TaxID=2816962 RepID=UPI0022371CB5|nr:phenylacetate--CoA ligase family protein [Aureitalea sp. L0-47]MCW5519963.1 phenylacetate--CoA ligase family protein [Aureitalea sp. L0-47]